MRKAERAFYSLIKLHEDWAMDRGISSDMVDRALLEIANKSIKNRNYRKQLFSYFLNNREKFLYYGQAYDFGFSERQKRKIMMI